MKIENYFGMVDGNLLFTRQQASQFAKSVAGDFNPIHDIDARRFCVPGDLLFAVVLHLNGVSRTMDIDFLNMVDSEISLKLTAKTDGLVLSGPADKDYLAVQLDNDVSHDAEFISALTSAYVRFSGMTFPFLLVDLMQQHQLMINPARPLVFYRSMSLRLDGFGGTDIKLQFSSSSLVADGKKARVILNFDIFDGERMIGTGDKKMVLGGLRKYEQSVVDELVWEYQGIKSRFQESGQSDSF